MLLLIGVLVTAGCDAESPQVSVPLGPSTETVGTAAAKVDSNELLQDACQYLWSQQQADGSWRSEQYAVLRGGAAYTPFILHTLLSVPSEVCPRDDAAIERSLAFLRAQVNDQGALGRNDPDVLEYPHYATAYALRALLLAGKEQDRTLALNIRDYLVGQQYCERNGFEVTSPAYGGWGFGGSLPPGHPGHMDLAHTRRVLAALAELPPQDRGIFERAEDFLRMVQRHPNETRPQPAAEPGEISGESTGLAPFDGGFYFSPVVLAANKGRVESSAEHGPYFRSYATATCDGVLALLAAGVPANDERVIAAKRWLANHPRLDYPEGIPADHPDPWGAALYYYHLAVRAEAYRALEEPIGWSDEIAAELSPRQRADGSFVNTESTLMKEDDPLLATTLAVIALASGRR